MLFLDTLWLLSDTLIPYSGVVWNTIDVIRGSAYIRYSEYGVIVSPLGDSSAVSFLRLSLNMDSASPNGSDTLILPADGDAQYDGLMFSGNMFMGAGFSRGVYPRNSLNLSMGGRIGDALIEGVISARDFRESYYLEELEESYLRVSSAVDSIFLEGGVFKEGEFRLFGLRGRWGGLGLFAGYERAMYGRRDHVAEPGRRVYEFADAFTDVIYGSVRVMVDGKPLKEGFWVDYDARSVVFDPSYPLQGGSTISIGYMYYAEGVRRDFMGISYGNFRLVQREERVRFVSDSLRNASAPGYFPTYFRDTVQGKYIMKDSIFVYVGEGRGEYVVEFFPIPGGDYEYQPDGDFYYFVGRGKGSYSPVRYMSPPSRERRLEFRGDAVSISIVEENPNYLRFQRGTIDFEGELERRFGDFHIYAVRKRNQLSPYAFPINPLNLTSGTYFSIDYRGLGVFVMDSIYGFSICRDWLEGFLYRGGGMFRLSLSRKPFRLLAYANSINEIVDGSIYVGDEIFSLVKLTYGRDTMDYAFGGGVSSRLFRGSFLYWLLSKRISARLNITTSAVQGSFLYDRLERIRYMDRYVYVGEGLGNFEYDPVSGRYYFHRGGRFNRLRVPIDSDSTGSVFQGSLSFDVGWVRGYAFVDRESYGLNVSSRSFYFSLSRWQETIHGESSYSVGIFRWGIEYDTDYAFKYEVLAGISGIMAGAGIYSSGVPFLRLDMDAPLLVKLEYRFGSVSPAYDRGLDLSVNFTLGRNVSGMNIRVFGILIYRNNRLFKNLSIGISRQF